MAPTTRSTRAKSTTPLALALALTFVFACWVSVSPRGAPVGRVEARIAQRFPSTRVSSASLSFRSPAPAYPTSSLFKQHRFPKILQSHSALGGGSFGKPPVLKYFDAKGAAEIVRYLFAVADENYDDYRYPMQMEGMFGQPGFKVTKEEFDKDKADGKMPFQKVPIMEVEGVTLAQSKAIERFVAKKLGLFGKTDLESAQIDMICEQIRDIKDSWLRARGHKMKPDMEDKDVVNSVENFFKDQLPAQMDMLQKQMDTSGYFVGDTITLADISFYHFVKSTFFPPFGEKIPDILAKYPKLVALNQNVQDNPSIKTWEEKRPQTAF